MEEWEIKHKKKVHKIQKVKDPCLRFIEIIKYIDKINSKNKHEIHDCYAYEFNLIFFTTLEEIREIYSLFFIDTLISNNKSILTDNSITYISPLLFEPKIWKKIIIHELSISFDEDTRIMKYSKFFSFLCRLDSELINVNKVPIIAMNWQDFDEDWLNSPELLIKNSLDFAFLEYFIDFDEIEKEFKRDINNQIRVINLRKIELENLLKKRKLTIEPKKRNYKIKKILKGLTHLIFKQNKDIDSSLINDISLMILQDLFYIENPKNIVIPIPYKINNKVLMEYLIFLFQEKKYFTNKENEIVSVLSKNLDIKYKGFSYKNLNKIYKRISNTYTLSFNGLTNISALREVMK